MSPKKLAQNSFAAWIVVFLLYLRSFRSPYQHSELTHGHDRVPGLYRKRRTSTSEGTSTTSHIMFQAASTTSHRHFRCISLIDRIFVAYTRSKGL